MDRSEGNQEDSRDSARNRNTTDPIVTDQDEDKDEDEEVTSGQADNSVVEQLPPAATDSALSTQPTIDDPMESLGERIGAEGDRSPISSRPSSVMFDDLEGSLEELSLRDMGASASGTVSQPNIQAGHATESKLSQFILVTEVRPVQVVNRNADEKVHLESNFPHDNERINFLMDFLLQLPRQRDQDENIHNILETFETDRTLPDVDDNMANDANDYERFVSEFVYIAEQYLMNHSAVVSAVMRSLCTTAMNLQRGCLTGQLRFKKGGDVGLFLARLLSGQLSLLVKDEIFGDDFFTKFDTQEDAAGLQQWIRRAFAKVIHVEIAVLAKQLESCVGDFSKPLDICITAVGPKKRSAGDPQTLKAWEVGMKEIMERNPDVNSVFSLCYPEESENKEARGTRSKDNQLPIESTTGDGKHVDKDNLADLLICIICKRVARPLLITDCQHLICQGCVGPIKVHTEEQSSIEKIECPYCRKLVTLLERPSILANKIGKMIGHPEYAEDKHPHAGDKPTQTVNESSSSDSNIINDTESREGYNEAMSRSRLQESILTLSSNPSQKLMSNPLYPGDGVILEGKPEKVGFILDINNSESVYVTVMFPHDEENVKEGEGSLCWRGKREQLEASDKPINIPQIGDLVQYVGGKQLSQSGIRGELTGFGYLTDIGPKDVEGTKNDRMCVVEDLDERAIEVLYSGLALETELHAKQRVNLTENGARHKGTIDEIDDAHEYINVSVDGDVKSVSYNQVEPDRCLRAGDHVKVIPKRVEAQPYDIEATSYVPLTAGDIGVVLLFEPTSDGYDDEVLIELYRLPYLRIVVKMTDVEMISRRDGMASRKKYHTILNELFLVDRDLQDYPQALADEQNIRVDTDKDKDGKAGASSKLI